MNMQKTVSTLTTAVVLGTCLMAHTLQAQSATPASSDDKKFLHDLGEDSNFEMASARLALQKSPSADVKAYAQMVLTDHRKLQQETSAAARAVQVTPVGAGSMSVSSNAEMLKLKVLSGTTFDSAYIKGLISGNEDIQKQEKAEAASSSVPAVKAVAAHGDQLDTKHADKAKALATAHHVQS